MTTAKHTPLTLEDTSGAFARDACDAHRLVEDARTRAKENEHLNAFVELPSDEARTYADASNALRAADGLRSTIAGAPIAIADNIVTQWGRTRAGSRMLADYQSPFNATVVDALLRHGALPFGKTNVAEFGVGATTQSSRHGATRNPASNEHLAGGAAGGAAAAVAANIVPAALAVDTLGGLRHAAARCGVMSLRPTYGAISRLGVVAYASSFDAVGIIGHTVRDMAVVYNAIAGHDPNDGTSQPAPSIEVVSALDEPMETSRVGIIKELMALPMDDPIRVAVERTRALLESKGCTVVDVSMPSAKQMAQAASVIAAVEASTNFARYDGVRFGYRTENPQDIDTLYSRSRAEGFGADIIHTILLGTQLLYKDAFKTHHQRAQRIRHRVALDYKHIFDNDVDFLLGPVAPSVAPRADSNMPTPLEAAQSFRFTTGESLAALPAVTLPAGTDDNGLPIGVQLTGKPFGEAALLRAASTLETWMPSHNAEGKS